MTAYNFYSCPKGHVTRVKDKGLDRRTWYVKCKSCKLEAEYMSVHSPLIGGVSMTDKSVKDFRYVFDRKTYGNLKTAGDVDRALDDFHRRYPHLKHPGSMKRDPLPDVNLRDERGNNGEY